MLQEVYDAGLIESPESLYSAFSKASHGKAVKNATQYWADKIESILPDMPESRREKPIRLDFISIVEFEEKVSKYQAQTWDMYDSAAKLEASETEDSIRSTLEEKMETDIENQVSKHKSLKKLIFLISHFDVQIIRSCIADRI